MGKIFRFVRPFFGNRVQERNNDLIALALAEKITGFDATIGVGGGSYATEQNGDVRESGFNLAG